MKWYRFLKSSDDGTTVTVDPSVTSFVIPKISLAGDGTTGTTGTAIKIGTSSVPIAINTAGQRGINTFFSSTATSDTTYGMYLRLDATGAGVEAIAGRFKTTISSDTTGQAYGIHATVEPGATTGKITGQCAAVLGNLVMADRAFGAGGTYYGVLAQVYAAGNVMTAGNISCLGISCIAGTEIDKVCYAINFSGTDSASSMIYTRTAAPTITGHVRVLINGAVRYMPFATTLP
jgi:hypothetical protein